MVELVDTTDLNSVDPNGSCGFKSRSGYREGEFRKGLSFCFQETLKGGVSTLGQS